MKIPMMFICFKEIDVGIDKEINSLAEWLDYITSLPEEEFHELSRKISSSIDMVDATIETLGHLDTAKGNGVFSKIEFSRAAIMQESVEH